MTCKDCIHEKVCKHKDRPIPLCDCTYDESDNVEKIGCPFADKSRFVELPFAIGQTVYRIVCDCASCEYLATESCYARNECSCNFQVKKMKYGLFFFVNKIECFATRDEAEKALKERYV